MKLPEFLKVYCQDILERYRSGNVGDEEVKNYDDIIQDEDGNDIKVVYIDGEPVDIEEFFSNDDTDFYALYNHLPSAMEIRAKYLSRFEILLGADALRVVLMEMQEELEKTARNAELYKEYINDQNTADEEGSAMERRLYSGEW